MKKKPLDLLLDFLRTQDCEGVLSNDYADVTPKITKRVNQSYTADIVHVDIPGARFIFESNRFYGMVPQEIMPAVDPNSKYKLGEIPGAFELNKKEKKKEIVLLVENCKEQVRTARVLNSITQNANLSKEEKQLLEGIVILKEKR